MKSVKEDATYSSPTYKLCEFFQKSRDQWKTKALERKQQIRRLEKRIADLEASRRHWKEKAKAQRASAVVNDNRKKKGT